MYFFKLSVVRCINFCLYVLLSVVCCINFCLYVLLSVVCLSFCFFLCVLYNSSHMPNLKKLRKNVEIFKKMFAFYFPFSLPYLPFFLFSWCSLFSPPVLSHFLKSSGDHHRGGGNFIHTPLVICLRNCLSVCLPVCPSCFPLWSDYLLVVSVMSL